MKQKLFLHVGIHRTATTSVQQFMKANAATLLTMGYFYPFGVQRHNAIVQKIAGGSVSIDDFCRDLMKRADSKDAEISSIVISDEDMSEIRDFAVFADLSRHFDVKVVLMLRRQDLWLESWYLQNVKWQWNRPLAHLTFKEFFELRQSFFWIDYAERLKHYEAIFGEGSVIAGVFETSEMKDGPIQAFLRLIGIHDQSGLGPFVHANTSLSPMMTEFMRQLPLDEYPGPKRAVFERACVAADRSLVTNGSKLIMSHDQRLIVQQDYKDSNEITSRKYFGRATLFADPLPPANAPLADAQLPTDVQTLMRQFVVPMVNEISKAWPLPEPAKDRAGEKRRAP